MEINSAPGKWKAMFNERDSERAEGSICREIGSSKSANPRVIIQFTHSMVKNHKNSPVSQSNPRHKSKTVNNENKQDNPK